MCIVTVFLCLPWLVQSSRPALSAERTTEWLLNDQNHKGPYYGQPEQIHLSYAGIPSAMFVTWVTFDDTLTSFVSYGMDMKLDHSEPSEITRFRDGDTVGEVSVDIYGSVYRVGSDFGWSSIFSFRGLEERPDGGFRYAIFGDMGNENARSLGKLQRQAQDGEFDMVIHNGDFAYDMHDKNGKVGDEFMRQIEPMAAYVPYMVSAGNHERSYNFSHYINRFTMPNTDHNLYYSFDLGLTHFVAYSTELYYWRDYYDETHIQSQFEWLKRDLKRANENRARVPWVVVFGHRSMYCSDVEGHCVEAEKSVREGIDRYGSYGLEKLFFETGVDLVIGAHEHNYERHWPLFNFTVLNGTDAPYQDPPAPVHIVTGSAGCKENTTHFPAEIAPWSAFRSSNYGFSQMQVYNSTHLYFEQVKATNEEVEDRLWLIKRGHPLGDHDRINQWPTLRHYKHIH